MRGEEGTAYCTTLSAANDDIYFNKPIVEFLVNLVKCCVDLGPGVARISAFLNVLRDLPNRVFELFRRFY